MNGDMNFWQMTYGVKQGKSSQVKQLVKWIVTCEPHMSWVKLGQVVQIARLSSQVQIFEFCNNDETR